MNMEYEQMEQPTLPATYPGSSAHQRLLRAITEYHTRQPWALALLVFGSVGRGDWDDFSDLDLDVVIADDVVVAPVAEINRLCAAIGERPALIAPRRGDDGDVVLDSLAGFSIRYHPLASTSPNIIASMRLLWGRLGVERIRAAGLANARPSTETPETLVALCVRTALDGATALARGRRWSALAALEQERDLLMTLAALAHGAERPMQGFERTADAGLRAELARTVAAWEPASLRAALLAVCDLLAQRLDGFSAGLAQLTEGERAALDQIRARLTEAGDPQP
jgi:predicted nucleotidyltransferase